MCDTVVAVSEGSVLWAKNSDRDANEAQLLEWHPRRQHAQGSTVRCTWIEVPQVPETAATLISRPFWMWGAEMGANEHGVVIGNEAVWTDQPYAATGLTGMDLLRLALERASSASAAVTVITELLSEHGQGGGCGHERRSDSYHNSFLLADPSVACVLETAGQQWAVEEVRAGVRSISNGLTIPGFAEAHSDRLRTTVSACALRRPQTERAASRDATLGGLMAALRGHGSAHGPRYALGNGAMSGPCMHAGGVLASAQTTGSWVSELTADGCSHWVTATAAPCTSLFKPVSVDQPLDLGPAPIDRFDPGTLWWRHELLHRATMRDPAATSFAAERDEIERRWLADPPAPADAFAQADALSARWLASLRPTPDRRPWWVRRYWQERDRRAGMPQLELAAA